MKINSKHWNCSKKWKRPLKSSKNWKKRQKNRTARSKFYKKI